MWYRILIVTCWMCASLYANAQPPAVLKNYFRNPLDIPMQLSANFGELRPNHWHMGLDIRTDAKENLRVYAAAEGYVAKVGIRPQSFGRFIIINHPNGLSTLYAHLNDFNPALEAYVTSKQYEQESWAVELNFTRDQFPMRKGDFLAYSGNTGGSQGPHLHFEIIDTKTDKRLNPLLFNFPMQDNVAPVITRLAMYDRERSTYAQTPVLYTLKKTDTGYIVPKDQTIITGLRKISFAIQATDKMNGGGSDNGIFAATILLDSIPQLGFILDSIDYIETADINGHIDYRHDYNGGAYLQHVSQLPGDHCPIYKHYNNDGVISLDDTLDHLITIEVKDVQGNTSVLNFRLRYNDSLARVPFNSVAQKMLPNRTNSIIREDFQMRLKNDAIYDTVPAIYSRTNPSSSNNVSAVYQVNDPSYPLRGDAEVRIKPNRTIPPEWDDKLIMLRSGKGNTVRKVELKDGWFSAAFGDFGSFQVVADVTSPQINELGKGDTVNLTGANRIVFSPTDNIGIVKKFRVELDGQWLRFTNDKSRNWIYKFDERCPYGVHQLTATATDLAGNVTTKTWWFRRNEYVPPPPKKKIPVKKTIKGKKAVTTKASTNKTVTGKKATVSTKKTAPVKKKK